MEDVVIVAAGRTAVGKFGGTLAKIPAAELGAQVIKHLLDKTGIDPAAVSEVIMGQVLTAGVGQNPARQALIKAGLPEMVPGYTINKVCGSGLKATHLATQAIRCGDADIVIAGGQENMSASPHVLSGSRDGFRMGDAKLVDTMINDGLWDAFNGYHMGVTAENVARKYEISRAEQDEFALQSQLKAEAAQKEGRFKDEIIPIEIVSKKVVPVLRIAPVLDDDVGVRFKHADHLLARLNLFSPDDAPHCLINHPHSQSSIMFGPLQPGLALLLRQDLRLYRRQRMLHATNQFAVMPATFLFTLAVTNRHNVLLYHPLMAGVFHRRVLFTNLNHQPVQHPFGIPK